MTSAVTSTIKGKARKKATVDLRRRKTFMVVGLRTAEPCKLVMSFCIEIFQNDF
jgi:hypothetical protein